MPFPTIAALKAELATVLRTASGIGVVETKYGGLPTWLRDPRPGRNFWVVHFSGRAEQSAGVGTQALQLCRFRVEGWMPHSYQNPDTTTLWDALLEAVTGALRGNQSLGQTSGVIELRLPGIGVNDMPVVPTPDGDAVECHHAVLTCEVQTYAGYSTV